MELRLEVERVYVPSWNDLLDMHWGSRAELMSEIKNIVWAECSAIPIARRKMAVPVQITIEGYFKGGQRRDPDNLYVKPVIDGIVAAKVIPDDNGEVVESVVLRAKRNQKSDKIIILIESVNSLCTKK